MSNKKVWFITGAGRGLGVGIAKAALTAGHAVVATGRDPAKVTTAIGAHDSLLSIALDVTRPEQARNAVEAAVNKFGHIDVLVNNAGNFYAGFFEELSPDQVRHQIETLLFGPMNVARAALAERAVLGDDHNQGLTHSGLPTLRRKLRSLAYLLSLVVAAEVVVALPALRNCKYITFTKHQPFSEGLYNSSLHEIYCDPD